MAVTVESLCNSLVRSRLLQPTDVKALYTRWKGEAKTEAANTDKFTRWLVQQRVVTEYQASLIAKGQVDNFFLDDYKIIDRLGQGRMAGIYEAVHKLGTKVAIKVLPPSKARVLELFSRFQREARMSLQMKHPNVVRTFQVGECRGLHYIVMEYLHGETLEDTLKRRGKLQPVEAVRLVYQALLGLQHIHEQSIIHRDLKPANLMLVPPPQAHSTMNSNVKILDIGLGKIFDEDLPGGLEQVQLTTDGQMLGAPEYMAPEQARDATNADIRSDIYSLGCVLYHALAGQSPYYDVNVVRIMVKHATEAARPLRELNPQVPDGLQQIVNVMLAKDPDKRYQTPDRAAQALQVFLASGSEASPRLEAQPGMQAYLNWLDGQPGGQPPIVAAPGSAVPAVVVPVPVPMPAPARPSAQGNVPNASASMVQRRSAVASGTPTPQPQWHAAPAAHAPSPVVVTASAADVELVPQGGAHRPIRMQHGFGKRDVLLLGVVVGIALVLVAGLLAFGLHMLLRSR